MTHNILYTVNCYKDFRRFLEPVKITHAYNYRTIFDINQRSVILRFGQNHDSRSKVVPRGTIEQVQLSIRYRPVKS